MESQLKKTAERSAVAARHAGLPQLLLVVIEPEKLEKAIRSELEGEGGEGFNDADRF